MDLVALEHVKRAKYRYLRCVDLKLWDELADALTADATAEYGTPALGTSLSFTGRTEILDFLHTHLGGTIITTHSAGQPEIDIDGDAATGTWSFEDTVIAPEYSTIIKGSAFYRDRYRRDADGTWRICHTGYLRLYEMSVSTEDVPSLTLTANRWADPSGTHIDQ